MLECICCPLVVAPVGEPPFRKTDLKELTDFLDKIHPTYVRRRCEYGEIRTGATRVRESTAYGHILGGVRSLRDTRDTPGGRDGATEEPRARAERRKSIGSMWTGTLSAGGRRGRSLHLRITSPLPENRVVPWQHPGPNRAAIERFYNIYVNSMDT